MRHARRLIGPLIAGLCFLAGCSTPLPPNVLLIVIDTLRADRVDWYQGERHLTPFLGTLAARGTVFWSAYAQSSWTSPSVASLLTSRFQSQHGVITWASVLSANEVTLPEILKAHGYATGGFVGNRLLSAKAGFSQGFDAYESFATADHPRPGEGKERAERVNQASLSWLDTLYAAGRPATPAFLYMHYMEPHMPYGPPSDLAEQMMRRHGKAAEEQQRWAHMLFTEPKLWASPDADALRVIEDLYDAEVISLDTQLRAFFAALEARGFLRNAVVVITADHGEELLDHGRCGHGMTLYNEVIRVPLLVLAPGHTQRTDVHDVVSLVDVAPTLLDFADISQPRSFEGHSARPLIGSPAAAFHRFTDAWHRFTAPPSHPSVAYSQLLELADGKTTGPTHHSNAVVVGTRKLIVGTAGREGYDLQADPGERHPDALEGDRQAALQQMIGALLTRAGETAHRERADALDERTKDAMRALGYGD